MEMETGTRTQLLLINDMAGYGKVALSVMIPVFSHLKYETFNLPTALVSNTLDYGHFHILDTTEYMRHTIEIWKALSFSFDAICTGFIVSEQQSSLVYQYCKEQRKIGTRIFVDPIMGDDGKRYNGVTDASVSYMRQLCSTADVIVPNITEACFLSDYPIKDAYSKHDMEEITTRLHHLGATSVIITSTNINGHMFTVVKNSLYEPMVLLPYQEIPVRFPGTGDIFMSLVVSSYMRSGELIGSVRKAMRHMEKIIRSNMNNKDKYKGIPIEQFLEDIDDEKTKIKIRLVDQKGHMGCHRGHKIGDTFDFDTERGNLCPMAMHVAFPYVDILRYGGTLPSQPDGSIVFCCPDVDVINVFRIEVEEEQ